MRVASLYLVGADDLRDEYTTYEMAYTEFRDAIDDLKKRGLSGSSKGYTAARWAGNAWVHMLHAGERMAAAVLKNKVAPKGKAKKLEMVARLVMSARRLPRDFFQWFDKNKRHLELLLDAYAWDDKSENSAAMFKLGPFTIHNTLGLTGKELEGVTKSLDKAVGLVKKSKLPGFSKVLYGDVFVVGQLLRRTVMAWYNPQDDTVSVRPLLKIGPGEIHNLVHELGHRYWSRFANREDKQVWAQHHYDMQFERPDVGEVELPGVGDPIPVRVKGHRGDPIAIEIRGGQYIFDVKVGGQVRRLSIPVASIKTVLLKSERIKAERAKYPTPYASTNHEEHFCEALALRATGKLKEPHLSKFEEIWG